MSLIEQIETDLAQALKKRDQVKVMTLRLLKSALHNEQIAQKSQESEISDEIILTILKREVKKRREAYEAFTVAGRTEQAIAEEDEMKILEKYLPAQLSSEEIEKKVVEILATTRSVRKEFWFSDEKSNG